MVSFSALGTRPAIVGEGIVYGIVLDNFSSPKGRKNVDLGTLITEVTVVLTQSRKYRKLSPFH